MEIPQINFDIQDTLVETAEDAVTRHIRGDCGHVQPGTESNQTDGRCWLAWQVIKTRWDLLAMNHRKVVEAYYRAVGVKAEAPEPRVSFPDSAVQCPAEMMLNDDEAKFIGFKRCRLWLDHNLDSGGGIHEWIGADGAMAHWVTERKFEVEGTPA